MTADELLDGKVTAGAPQMSADALLDTPAGPGAGAPVLGTEGLTDRTDLGDRTDPLPGRPLVPPAEGFSVDMGAEQAVALRDRVVDAQLKVDDERLNARVFKPGDNPWRVVDGELIVDPERFGLATDMMWRYGVIDSDRYAKMLAAAPDVESLAAGRKDLERRAGDMPELKSALEGAGVAGAAMAGGMAAGATAGRMTAGLPKPVSVGATLLAGAVGAVASGAAADAAVEEVAKYNAAADALLAAKELKPGYNLAGSLATIAVPVPGALRNVSTAINTLRAERGAAEATKFATAVLGGGAAFGAAVDAGSQLAHQKIFDGLHPELQPMLRAEMERQAAERGKQLEERPEFSPASLGISTALGALTAGMGVRARNKVYAPDELVAMENRVLSQRGSRDEVQDYDVMRRAVATLRNDEGLLAADGVRRATVDVYGSKVLDVTEIVNPRFRMRALADAGMNGRNGMNVPALVESNPNARAAVPVEGSPGPVYQGQNFVDRGGPGPVFAGGEMNLPAGTVAAGALPAVATAVVGSAPAVSADDLLDGVVLPKVTEGTQGTEVPAVRQRLIDSLNASIPQSSRGMPEWVDGQGLVRAVVDMDPKPLILLNNGVNLASLRAVAAEAGFKLPGGKKPTQKAIGEAIRAWAGPEKYDAALAEVTAKREEMQAAEDKKSNAWRYEQSKRMAAAVQAKYPDGSVVPGDQAVNDLIASGYTRLVPVKKGAVPQWYLVNQAGSSAALSGDMLRYAKLHLERNPVGDGKNGSDGMDVPAPAAVAPEAVPAAEVTKAEAYAIGNAVYKVGTEIKTAAVEKSSPVPRTIRDDVIGQLQEELQTAPLRAEAGKPELISVSIPGDGDFKIFKTKEAIAQGIKSLSKLSVKPGPDAKPGLKPFKENNYKTLEFTDWTDPQVVPAIEAAIAKGKTGLDGILQTAKQLRGDNDVAAPKASKGSKVMADMGPDDGAKISSEAQARELLSGISKSAPNPTIRGKLSDILKWFEANLVGQRFVSPIGTSWTIKPGHFFRLVAGKDGNTRKGFVEGFKDSSEVLSAISAGTVTGDKISGFSPFRAKHLSSVRELFEDPDLIVKSVNVNGQSGIQHFKWFSGNAPFLLAGFQTSSGEFAVLSYHPRNLKPKDLVGADILYKKSGNRVPRPAAPGPLTAEQEAGSDLRRSMPKDNISAGNVKSASASPTEYSSDAQVYADFPDAVGVYRSSGGWRMPIILGATDLVPVVEMPEIIELWRELTGQVPGIKVKMGDALGTFLPAGSGSVTLRADLFQNEKSALMTLMHEVGHGFHYMDSGKMARGNILGIIAGLVNHMGHAIPAVPGLDPVGVEGYGFSGVPISKAERAEIVARAEADLIASLVGEVRRILMEVPVWAESGVTVEMVKGMFGTDAREAWPVMYDWFARQDAETKKAIVVAAMRGVVDPRLEHLKSRVQVGTETVEQEVSTGRAPTGDELRVAFDNALRAEMDARNIVDLKYVRDELVGLTRWWKPYDHRDAKRRAYRESGAELYADAMSVLLNSPADLKARAPVFWRAWWAYLDARPKVKAKLMEVQGRILSGREAVLSKREGLAKEGFATGAEMFLRKQAEATARRTQLAGWWEDLKDQYWDKFYPLTSAAAGARAAGKISRADEDGIRWMLEEHPMADGMLQVKLADIGRIYHRLDDARIPRADLGYLMSLQRIANERIVLEQDDESGEVTKVTGRSVMANPGGETARTAQEQMDRLRSIWGEDKWALVTGAAADFRGIFLSVMEEGRRAGLYSDDTWARIEGNADVYAAFTPVKYVQEFLPAAIRKQVGTFEQIADPVQQTTLKMVAVWRAAKNNAFVAGAVREVGRVLPEAVRDAPMKYDGKRMVPQAPRESGWRLVTWMEGGKLQGAHMLERYARMWERQSPADRDAILRVLMTGFTNTVYSAIIRYNPAFQLFMSPVRDLQRSVTNMPGGVAGRGRLVARLMDPQVWGAALDWARGDVGRTALMREMMEVSAVGGPHTAFGGRMGTPDDALDGMLKRFHVQNDHKARGIFLNALMSPLRGIEFAGQVLQMLPKAAAYKVLARDMGWAQGQAANMIRNHIGIPNYYKKGRHVAAAGSLVPFLNIFLRGYDSLSRTARGAERGQSAGAWWLAWLLTGGGLITVMQTLAREGMMGDDLRKLYERIPEWDMTNYMNLPLGEVPTGSMGGKTVYARLPMDEGLRVVNATVHKALTAAIRAGRGDKVKPGVGDVVSGVSATVPGINPLLAIGSAWKAYAEGQNPRDDFRNRDILTEDEWRAGGWPAVSKMMGWTLGQTGITNFFSYDRNADSLTEVAVGSTPVLNRVIKITDRGLAQSEEAQQRAEDAVMARVRASLPTDVQGLRTEYYYLQRRGDRMSDDQANRYGELSLWMKAYRRTLADVETYLEMQEPQMAEAALRELRAESKEYRAR